MDILKTANNWAKAEVFSSMFFIVVGILFVLAAIGFWQLGKTELAKAFVVPISVAAVLLLIIGAGLVYSNQSRIAEFPTAYEQDASAFVQSEIARAEKTMAEYQMIVFKIVPLIIVLAAFVIAFVGKSSWQAIGMTTIALMIAILLIDSNANARMETYHQQLTLAEKNLKNE
ncbi:MAG: hypothetical protein AAFV95_08550 [Bacteroidota bacterium]